MSESDSARSLMAIARWFYNNSSFLLPHFWNTGWWGWLGGGGEGGNRELVKQGHDLAWCPKPWHRRHWSRSLVTTRLWVMVPAFVTISSSNERVEGSSTTTRTLGTPTTTTASTNVSCITHPKWAPRSLMMSRSSTARPGNWRVTGSRGLKRESKSNALKPLYHGTRRMIFPSIATRDPSSHVARRPIWRELELKYAPAHEIHLLNVTILKK